MMLSVWVLLVGAGLAYTPEGKLEVLVPGRDAKITFQEIDENKVLASVLDAQKNPVKDLMTEDFKVIKGGIDAIVTNAEILKSRKDVPINYVLMVDNSYSMKERNAVEPLLAALDEFLKIVRPIDEVQVVATFVVLSKLVPSLNVSIAVYCWMPVTGIEAVTGVTFKPFEVAAFTVKLAVAVLPPKEAVMTTGRALAVAPVAKPLITPKVATPGAPEVQVDNVVTLRDDPLSYIAVAVNCTVPVTGIETVAGETITETKETTAGSLSAHPAIKVTSSKAKNHNFEYPLHLFIFVPSFMRTF